MTFKNYRNMYLYNRSIEIKYAADVLVVGGGPAGICAAVASARQGAKTILVEQNAFSGGMATAGLVAPFMTCFDSGGNTRLIRGMFEEVVDRMCVYGGALQPSEIPTSSAFTSYITNGHIHVTPFKAETLKLVADEMLEEAGVHILYHTSFVDTEVDNNSIKHVIVHQKEGLSVIEAKIIIDCSGDADVAAFSGVPFRLGNKKTEKIQPATMFFTIGNVDSDKIDEDIEKNLDNFYRKDGVNYRSMHWWVSKARENGDWNFDRVSIGLFRGVDKDMWHINTSRIMGIDGTKSESLTKGEIIGRQQVKEIFDFIVKYIPGCENAKLLCSGSTLGIRETRHVEGIEKLTIDNVLNCEVPEDSILLAANSVDIHGKFGPKSNEYITLPEGKYYGVSYGCLLPQGIDNLLVAGRSISAESDAAGAIRVMPPCMGLGQAAGVAASLCIKNNINPREVDTIELREILKKTNVVL